MKNNQYKNILYVIIGIITLLVVLFFIRISQTFNVNFITGGGTIYPSLKVGINERVQKPEDPVLEGFIFENWYDEDTNELFDFSKPISKNTNIVAKYKKVQTDISYNVNFLVNNNIILSIDVNENSLVVKPEDPVIDGYRFLYWVDDFGKEFDFSKPISSNVNIYAKLDTIN